MHTQHSSLELRGYMHFVLFIVCLCSQNGATALHLAAREGRVDVVRLLTEAEAQVNIQDKVHVQLRVTYRVVSESHK